MAANRHASIKRRRRRRMVAPHLAPHRRQARRAEVSAESPSPQGPIPIDVFLASHGVKTKVKTNAQTVLASASRKRDVKKLLASEDYKALEAGLMKWRRVNNGKRREDLVGPTKKVATILERELKAAVEAAIGAPVGGSAARGTDMPTMRVDIKSSRSGQCRLRYKCACERALGTSEHTVLLSYEVEHRRLHVLDLIFVPSWLSSDIASSTEAEYLRARVAAGELTAPEAVVMLVDSGLVDAPCEHLVAAMNSRWKIPTGVFTLSEVAPVWQARQGHLVVEHSPDRVLGWASAPHNEKIEKLRSKRRTDTGEPFLP